jgi:hypothetical protein
MERRCRSLLCVEKLTNVTQNVGRGSFSRVLLIKNWEKQAPCFEEISQS